MGYAIVWEHFGEVSGEVCGTHPGNQYLIDVVTNSTSITGGVLYESTHPTVTIGLTRSGKTQQRPLLEVLKKEGKITVKEF